MPYRSTFYGVDVRDEISREFTDADGHVDDMLAGLHEIRARLMGARSQARPPGPAGRETSAPDSETPEEPSASRTRGEKKA